jgi:hypothetical protein
MDSGFRRNDERWAVVTPDKRGEARARSGAHPSA